MPDFHYSERDDQVFPELFRKGNFKVMQTCETGEVFCATERDTEAAAWKWIAMNRDNYPESSFHVEEAEA